MKTFSFLFGLIIALQSFMPCGDTDLVEQEGNFDAVLQKEPIKKDTSSDVCSPFCVCICCTTPSTVKDVSISSFIEFFCKNPKNVVENTGKYVDVSLPVWQPPQLGLTFS